MDTSWNHDRLQQKDSQVLAEMADYVTSSSSRADAMPDGSHLPFSVVILPDLETDGAPLLFNPGLPAGDVTEHLVRFGGTTMLRHGADRFCTVAETVESGRFGLMVLLSNMKGETGGYFLEYVPTGHGTVCVAERVPLYCGRRPLTE